MSKKLTVSVILVLLFISCGEKNNFEKEIQLSVTIPPYEDIVRNIVGNRAEINVLVPPGTNVHSYEPNPASLRLIYESDIYFRIGKIFQFENTIINKIGPENINKIVDCSTGINLINNDPHVWLSPGNAKIIAENILNTLVSTYPQHKNYFNNNYSKFAHRIDSVDGIIRSMLQSKKNIAILVYHPAWKYLADHYNLEEIAVERDGKSPKANDLKNFIDLAKLKGIKCIFFDPHFDESSALTIARSAQLEVDSLDPLPSDYVKNLSIIGEKFNKYLE